MRDKQPFDSIVVLSLAELLLGSIELSNIESARLSVAAAVDIRMAINEQLLDQNDTPTSNCIMQARVAKTVLEKGNTAALNRSRRAKRTYLSVDIAYVQFEQVAKALE